MAKIKRPLSRSYVQDVRLVDRISTHRDWPFSYSTCYQKPLSLTQKSLSSSFEFGQISKLCITLKSTGERFLASMMLIQNSEGNLSKSEMWWFSVSWNDVIRSFWMLRVAEYQVICGVSAKNWEVARSWHLHRRNSWPLGQRGLCNNGPATCTLYGHASRGLAARRVVGLG